MNEQPRKDQTRLAVFLNALVMPGSGHILLGQKVKGYAIASVVLVFLIAPLMKFVLSVATVSRGISFRATLSARILETFSTAWARDKDFILICLLVVIVVWLYGIIDLALKR